MLKKTEGGIWNGQHRDTDNIWDKTQIEDKHSHCQFDKSLCVIEERENLRKREKIHCHLSNVYFVTVNQFIITSHKYEGELDKFRS